MTLWHVVGFGLAAGVAFSIGQAVVGLVFALLARPQPTPVAPREPPPPTATRTEPAKFYNGMEVR